MRGVYVIGAAMRRFGKFPDLSVQEMGSEVVWRAIREAQISIRDVQMAYCGHAYQGSTIGQKVLSRLGMTGIPIVNVENACASGTTAAFGIWSAIASGMIDVGIAVGVENLTRKVSGMLPLHPDDLDSSMGRVMPSLFAMIARRHMTEYGTTVEQLAKISVKNHFHGSLNPYAQYQNPCTVEEVLSSRMICSPLTLLQCCPTGDGAAALVLASNDWAKKSSGKPIRLAAVVLRSGTRLGSRDMTSSDLTRRTSTAAYELAGVGPRDIDVCELHDCFTAAELFHYENLGFCPKGEGGRFIDEGRSGIEGDVAVNPSGGLLAKGHPLGATGIAQMAEIFWQLRGEAGKRQRKDARVGMTHTMGGAATGIDGASCAVSILMK